MMFFFLAPLLLGILIIIVVPNIQDTSDIDSCLDRGGSYDYTTCQCDDETTHPKLETHQCH